MTIVPLVSRFLAAASDARIEQRSTRIDLRSDFLRFCFSRQLQRLLNRTCSRKIERCKNFARVESFLFIGTILTTVPQNRSENENLKQNRIKQTCRIKRQSLRENDWSKFKFLTAPRESLETIDDFFKSADYGKISQMLPELLC